jgi:DNA modification methylase
VKAPYLDDADVRLYQGDVLDVLREMDEGSVQTCVTSPPYWGLRDYGEPGQLGLEPTPGEYVARMVEVFREVRRVLRDDGTLWLNLGDSYAADRGGTYQPAETLAGGVSGRMPDGATTNRGRGGGYMASRDARAHGLKHKDLVGIPWRVALALQDDGWWLRSDIIWAKPNPMPESITDRPTKAHEYIFLLTKSARYFYDAEAVKETAVATWNAADAYAKRQSMTAPEIAKGADLELQRTRGFGTHHEDRDRQDRNARSVWTITTKPYAGAHFATFPPELPSRCIKAGSATGDLVLDPFSGAATTALVARGLGRRAVGIELNPEYLAISADRLSQLSLFKENLA